jgi:hypothetical protein
VSHAKTLKPFGSQILSYRSDEIANFLREPRDRMNPISSIDLTDAAGDVLASSQSPPPPSLTFEDRPDFQALRESDPGTLVGEPRLGTRA